MLRMIAVQAQEDFLRHFFRRPTVVQKAPGEAEDHRLMLAKQSGEIESGLRSHQSNHCILSNANWLFTSARLNSLFFTLIDTDRL